jgi:hypothetical protein
MACMTKAHAKRSRNHLPCFASPIITTHALLLHTNKTSQLELYRDYNFTGTVQYYTWDQLYNSLCVEFSYVVP